MSKPISMCLTKRQILSEIKMREFHHLFELCGEHLTKKRLGYLRKQEIITLYNLNIIAESLPVDCVKMVKSFLY